MVIIEPVTEAVIWIGGLIRININRDDLYKRYIRATIVSKMAFNVHLLFKQNNTGE